jgi:hypothetical protein
MQKRWAGARCFGEFARQHMGFVLDAGDFKRLPVHHNLFRRKIGGNPNIFGPTGLPQKHKHCRSSAAQHTHHLPFPTQKPKP